MILAFQYQNKSAKKRDIQNIVQKIKQLTKEINDTKNSINKIKEEYTKAKQQEILLKSKPIPFGDDHLFFCYYFYDTQHSYRDAKIQLYSISKAEFKRLKIKEILKEYSKEVQNNISEKLPSYNQLQNEKVKEIVSHLQEENYYLLEAHVEQEPLEFLIKLFNGEIDKIYLNKDVNNRNRILHYNISFGDNQDNGLYIQNLRKVNLIDGEIAEKITEQFKRTLQVLKEE